MLHRLPVIAALLLAGCAAPGDLTTATDLVDFGLNRPGVERIQLVELINRGGATLVVTQARQTSGTEVFKLALPERLTLPPSQTLAVDAHYLPAAGSTAADEATFEFITDMPGVFATVKLRGQSSAPDCAVPDALDFGVVARGDTLRLETSLANGTPRDATAFVGPIESPQGEVVFSLESPAGELPVASGSPGLVALSFAPTEARDYTATVRLRRHQLCAEKAVGLFGTGVAAVLSWAPALADFGSVVVGAQGTVTITFSNQLLRPLELSGLAVLDGAQPSTRFHLAVDHLTVPAAVRSGDGTIVPGTAQLELVFAPMTTGPQPGQLVGRTGLSSQPTFSLQLRGLGAP